jgi:hypothetical protein
LAHQITFLATNRFLKEQNIYEILNQQGKIGDFSFFKIDWPEMTFGRSTFGQKVGAAREFSS